MTFEAESSNPIVRRDSHIRSLTPDVDTSDQMNVSSLEKDRSESKHETTYIVPRPKKKLIKHSKGKDTVKVPQSKSAHKYDRRSWKTPYDIIGNMDAVGFSSLRSTAPIAISEFFKAFTGLNRLFKEAKKATETDEKLDLINGILNRFFHRHAMGPIPSKESFTDLDGANQKKVQGVALVIQQFSTQTSPWEVLWTTESVDTKLRGIFFIARCWEWAEFKA
ncbi:hypothetical protein BDN70DRAFT_939692 [Pholiota conissans]|uniref:Uncharacterized protein n=1 Tax=Pholiota conissans TaxID=109636 RepID=A0A9P5YMD0_9AGAR|nr:hypothetical protein BDN70DRAFT_939692 [Pholiota conissans]